jgi:DNA-directed RNA polymerase subunit A'
MDDHVSGLYLLTSGDKKFDRDEFVQLIRSVDSEIEIPKANVLTGKEIFSLFLPKDFSTKFRSKSGEHVIIENGKLIQGGIDKVGVGFINGKIIDKLEKDYGSTFAKKFLYNITKLAIEILFMFGFSISISDQDLPEEAGEKIKDIIEEAKKDINKIVEDFKKKRIKALAGRTIEETMETLVNRRFSKILTEAREILEKYLKENFTALMVECGARGDLVNLVQTAAMVGQERVMGERIEKGYYGRPFPHFKKEFPGLEKMGFVSRGFKNGLSPFEFFFDAVNSRESLMDKSLKTRHSGYMERRLVGALQDLKVEYDGTIRDGAKRIIQFIPGEDGLDPSKIERVGIDVEGIANKIFR